MAEQPAPGAKLKRRIPKGRHLSAIKRQRQNERRAARNHRVTSRIREAIKGTRLAVGKKDVKKARESLKLVTGLLAKAAQRGLVNHRHASRHISRLSSLVQAAS